MDLHGYLRAMRINWWVIALATLLGLAVSILIVFRTPSKYESSLTFYVSTSTDAGRSPAEADQYAQRRVNSYVELLSSDKLASKIITDTKLPLAQDAVVSAISASAQPETVLLTATVTTESANQSQQIAEAIARQFSSLVNELDNVGSPSRPTVRLTVTSGPALDPMPVAPRKSLIVSLGLFVGLGLGFVAAILREVLDKTVSSADDLRSLNDAPVLATIPVDGAVRRAPMVLQGHAQSAWAEAVRQLRTNLQFIDATNPVRALAVTSSVASEGKSVTAVNLAAAFADLGQRVILIEADFRRPKAADYLGLERAVGLSNVLVGQVSLEDVVQTWGPSRLAVLASGTSPPNPSELLGGEAMAALLTRLRTRYDLIILDLPPLLPVADAAVASRLVDGFIVIVRFGKTTKVQIKSALRAVEAVDGRVLGTVLTFAPPKSLTYAHDTYQVLDSSPTGQEPVGSHDANSAAAQAPMRPQSTNGSRHRMGLRRPPIRP